MARTPEQIPVYLMSLECCYTCEHYSHDYATCKNPTSPRYGKITCVDNGCKYWEGIGRDEEWIN